MLSYSVSQTKWRITTEAENSARGSAFVFCYGDCHRRNCRRICTTGASFARADRTYNAAPNAKEKALSLTLSETTLQANVGSRLTQQLFSDRWPVLLQVVGDSADGHSIDARATFISLHLLQSLLQVFSLTYFLHQSVRAGWAFGVMPRRGRFGLFPSCFAGFTRWRRPEVQFSLDVLPLVAPEIHVLLASPSRSGLRPPFPAQPICFSTFRIGVPH